MKKNFLTVAAMMVVAFFVSTEIAKAADISFSGQIRSRWESNEQSGGNAADAPGFNNEPDDNIFTSTRLAATANVNDTTSAFIQMQSVRNWGNTLGGSTGTAAGDGNASNSVNNRDASVGIHQAYFVLKNFMMNGVDMKFGRQEIKLDGWRLFGNTIWTPGMQTHDAITFQHKHDNTTVRAGYILANEDGRNIDINDSNDQDVYFLWANYKGVLGGQFSGYYVFNDRGCGSVRAAGTAGITCSNGSMNFSTVGGRQAGKMFGLNYRGEFYYQFGRADGLANNVTGTPEVDMDAYMFGVRVGKAFGNSSFKPSLTLWYDYLSGTNDGDQTAGEEQWSSFNTLFDTGHKYYGLQDLFLGIGNGAHSGTRGLGLQDFAVKWKMNPVAGWTAKIDQHFFWTAESAVANPGTLGLTLANRDDGNYLGNELDVTLVNKYNANTKVMIGYSNFNGSATFKAIKNQSAGGGGGVNSGGNDANWFYVQFDVKF